MPMPCPKCGGRVGDEVDVCPRCGKRVRGTPEPKPGPKAATSPAPSNQAGSPWPLAGAPAGGQAISGIAPAVTATNENQGGAEYVELQTPEISSFGVFFSFFLYLVAAIAMFWGMASWSDEGWFLMGCAAGLIIYGMALHFLASITARISWIYQLHKIAMKIRTDKDA